MAKPKKFTANIQLKWKNGAAAKTFAAAEGVSDP